MELSHVFSFRYQTAINRIPEGKAPGFLFAINGSVDRNPFQGGTSYAGKKSVTGSEEAD